MAEVIDGIKLIRLNSRNINLPDDPSLPFKLDVSLRAPEFMEVTFVFMHGGTEELVVRGKTKEVLDKFIDMNNLRTHPRLRRLTVTGPAGVLEQIPKKE